MRSDPPTPPRGETTRTSELRPTPFGKYVLLDRLAVGGMAEVYLAKSFGAEGFARIVAIKRILPALAEEHDFIQMFIDEARIAGHFSHAAIVPIYELGKIGESHYIAMEYVRGKDLLQIINRFRKQRRHMPPAMAAYIASRVADGLEYAHQKRDADGQPMGLIHRDVSPQNVLISYDGQVKIIDFGIAKAATRTTRTQAGVLKGKFGYMSPELVQGIEVDHRSDIFALGTCLYEMLVGERLFAGDSDFATLDRVRNAMVPPLSARVPELPSELEDIVMRALRRDRQDRYQTAAEMRQALLGFLSRVSPPFVANKLGSWMRNAFTEELAREQARIDSYSSVRPPPSSPEFQSRRGSRPSTTPTDPESSPPGSSPPSWGGTGEDTLLADEPTLVTGSPFDQFATRDHTAELNEHETQVFFEREGGEEKEDPLEVSAEEMLSHDDVDEALAASREAELDEGATRPAFASPDDITVAPPAVMTPTGRQAVPAYAGATERLDAVRGRSRSFAPVRLAAGIILLLLTLSVSLAVWAALGRTPDGSLEVRTIPETRAQVFLDGMYQGRTPLRIDHVSPGMRRLEVRTSGRPPIVRDIDVKKGRTSLIDFALSRDALSRPPDR